MDMLTTLAVAGAIAAPFVVTAVVATRAALRDRRAAVEALRLTAEYASLPPKPGWAWWDVYAQQAAPAATRAYVEQWNRMYPDRAVMYRSDTQAAPHLSAQDRYRLGGYQPRPTGQPKPPPPTGKGPTSPRA